MEDFVRFAISKGVKKYGFSSHAPLPFLTKWTMLTDDFVDYEKEFHRLKEKYKNKIELYLGLEVDYIHECSDISNSFFSDKKLDYTIGSIHYLDKLSDNVYWSIDGAFRDFDEGLNQLFNGDIQAGTQRFFEISSLMVENGGFDIVGHADKITYHGMKYRNFTPTDKWFVKLMTNFLELIQRKNLILEINTKSLHEHGLTFPHQSFFRLILEMGIPIQVNSDCHYPTNVICDFQDIYKQLYDTGFRTMHQLQNGKWEATEFDKNGLK
jgi:histidinol-phosphatase (PHP family)